MALGDHYRAGIETWDYILSQGLGYMEGNIVKYVTRHRRKNGLEDLYKGREYLNKLIEVEENKFNASKEGSISQASGNLNPQGSPNVQP